MANGCVTNYFETRIFRFFRNGCDELKDSWISNIMRDGVLELDFITGIVVRPRDSVQLGSGCVLHRPYVHLLLSSRYSCWTRTQIPDSNACRCENLMLKAYCFAFVELSLELVPGCQ
jgi:hypothetical protein